MSSLKQFDPRDQQATHGDCDQTTQQSPAIRECARSNCALKPTTNAASSSYEGESGSDVDTTQMTDDQRPEIEPDTPTRTTHHHPRSTRRRRPSSTGPVNGHPSQVNLADLDAPLIGAFLNHLETDRGNSARTRNARLAAIHSLFRYAALRHPDDAAVIQRVLAIPSKRFDRALITYLTEDEITALLAAPDRDTWTGRRDHALLMLACQTGLRATELTHLTSGDVHLGTGAHVSCLGKGRKQRITPLTKATTTVLRAWLAERGGLPDDPLFPTRRGRPLSRDALERRLTKYTPIAAASCTTLQEKKISPHILRHSAAMRLLAAGIDTSVIALWLGHANVTTVQVYIHADLALKERALART